MTFSFYPPHRIESMKLRDYGNYRKARGILLYDRGLSVLEQYGLGAKSSYRGRGALLCQTQIGLVLIREFTGSDKKLKKQQD